MLIPYNLVKNAIELMYEGKCTVIVRTVSDDPRLEDIEDTIYKDVPCLVDFGSGSTEEGTANKATQTATLYINPSIKIPTGSKLVITQAGETMEFNKTGVVRPYESHKEYDIEAFKGWN